MKKAVLLSILPQWVEKISSGEKTLEVRKTRPALRPPFKCYIYETQGKTDTPWMDEDGHAIFRGRGAVVGEFICDEVLSDLDANSRGLFFMDGESTVYCEDVGYNACLSYADLFQYNHGFVMSLYGLHIPEFTLYDKPKELSNFRMANAECLRHGADGVPMCEKGSLCRMCRVKHPPQSWMYVEELV